VFELRQNVGVFSAFKVHHQQNDIANQLHDENGNLKSFSQWKKDVEPILSHYNRNWLQTEFSTAIMRARQAARFKKFERNADLFPNLKWLPSTSIIKRESHEVFYGLVKPIDDPFWKQHYPGNIWNCKCGITSTDEKAVAHTPAANYTPAPGLDENPVNGKIFTATHPYITKAYDGAEDAVKNAVAKTTNEIELLTLKSFENGGSIKVYKYLVNPKSNDYIQLRRICEWFAENKASECIILPQVHPKSKLYQYIYGSLNDTKYAGKCPDLLIDGKFYEYESYISSNPKKALKNMLNRGKQQSNRIIIEEVKIGKHYLEHNIITRIKQNQDIEEVLMRKGTQIITIYKRQKPDT